MMIKDKKVDAEERITHALNLYFERSLSETSLQEIVRAIDANIDVILEAYICEMWNPSAGFKRGHL